MIFKYIQKITGCRNLAIFVERRRTYAKFLILNGNGSIVTVLSFLIYKSSLICTELFTPSMNS